MVQIWQVNYTLKKKKQIQETVVRLFYMRAPCWLGYRRRGNMYIAVWSIFIDTFPTLWKKQMKIQAYSKQKETIELVWNTSK